MRRMLAWTLTVLSLCLFIAAGFLLLSTRSAPARPPADEVARRIRNLQTITTAEYRYRDVIYFGEETRFLGLPTGTRKILFAVSISVTAGVDLTHRVDVQVGDQQDAPVFVTLPPPGIVRVDAEERSINQYFVQERFGRIDWVEVSDEVEAAKDRNRMDAIERGILTKAEQQAEAVVRRLLQAGGFSTIHVRFRPLPDATELSG